VLLAHGQVQISCVPKTIGESASGLLSTEYCVTARFDEGDPTYDWVLLFLVSRPSPHFGHSIDHTPDREKDLAPFQRLYRQREEFQTQMGRQRSLDAQTPRTCRIRPHLRVTTAIPLEGLLGRGQEEQAWECSSHHVVSWPPALCYDLHLVSHPFFNKYI